MGNQESTPSTPTLNYADLTAEERAEYRNIVIQKIREQYNSKITVIDVLDCFWHKTSIRGGSQIKCTCDETRDIMKEAVPVPYVVTDLSGRYASFLVNYKVEPTK